MQPSLVLVSHRLCPYVQRAIILLTEKKIAYTRRDIDLSNKPDWFLKISPLGKTPVLLVDDQPVFESAVICEYLDELCAPQLHPQDKLHRARNRSWIEFGSVLLDSIASFYSAENVDDLQRKLLRLEHQFSQLEAEIAGPYFNGDDFSVVDAAFAPVFRYFDVFEQVIAGGFFEGLRNVRKWRENLAQRPSVLSAVAPQYEQWLKEFLIKKGSYLGRRFAA